MNHPLPGDYIDIHTHDSVLSQGIFSIENLMAHEGRTPGDIPDRPCTYGIHPWHLSKETIDQLICNVQSAAVSPNLVAIGEAGFDKLRGPDMKTQTRAFEEQVVISEKTRKPVFIHCVRAWDLLLPVHRRLRPRMPWLIHGFRGNPQLAQQLLAKGMYISFWFDFVMRPESAELLRSVAQDRIFLETDGSDADIRDIYKKVSIDTGIALEALKAIIHTNYNSLFDLKTYR